MNHMNMNNMNGVNVPNGIPAAMAAMNNGANGAAPRIPAGDTSQDFKKKLNTYIYDYMLKNEQYECARAILSSTLVVDQKPAGAKKRANGMDDGMNPDNKDNIDLKRPVDLPDPENILDAAFDNSFLLDWFTLFWEIFLAPRANRPQKLNPTAITYMGQNREQSRLRAEQQQNLLRQPGMPANMPQQYGSMMRGMGMQNNPGALQNRMLTQAQQRQVFARQQMAVQQQQAQQHMERAGSEVDMNGQGRPRTPSGETTPSPAKKPRLESPKFVSPRMMQNGRLSQVMPGQRFATPGTSVQQFLMHDDTDPSFAGSQQLSNFQNQNPQVQKKSLDIYSQTLAEQQRANMPVPTMANQGTAMMQNGQIELTPEFYANGNQMRPGGNMPPNMNGQGNHALQDYQMQLMLLEQQNKKRLLMARQEQDSTLRPDQQGNMPGQQAFAPGMSPQGSRSGPSPNPSEQMKRGTPKMGPTGLPGSPMADGNMHNRGSPAANMNFNTNTPMEMMQNNMKMGGVGEGMQMAPNGAGMRPPSSNPHQFPGNPNMNPQQLEMLRRQQSAQNGNMPNGAANWQQGQQQGQQPTGPQPGGQPGPAGTPQQRTAAMPPPQNVPAPGAVANGRAPSPAPSASATTPQTTNKANPKKAKGEKEPRKKPTKKNTATAATPNADSNDAAPTPQPQTPITPMHKSFNDGKTGQAPGSSAQAAAPTTAPTAPVSQQQADTDSMIPHFDDMNNGLGDNDVDMTFSGIDSEDVLNQFDFDQFITNDGGQDFDLSAFGTYDAGEGIGGPTG